MKTEDIKTLSDEDHQRIEQEVKQIMDKWGGFLHVDRLLYKSAEYATIYERTHILNRIVLAEAEHSELIRRIKSILKASTVHDKISILEELEQLLNSLKTK